MCCVPWQGNENQHIYMEMLFASGRSTSATGYIISCILSRYHHPWYIMMYIYVYIYQYNETLMSIEPIFANPKSSLNWFEQSLLSISLPAPWVGLGTPDFKQLQNYKQKDEIMGKLFIGKRKRGKYPTKKRKKLKSSEHFRLPIDEHEQIGIGKKE